MGFSAPLWLLGLLPWAAMTVWLLWGRRQRTVVPFLALWQGEPGKRVRRRALQAPPVALAALIIAVAIAILAAAGPVVRRATAGGAITVIVDRGVSMSAFGASGQPRYIEAARELDRQWREHGGGVRRVEVVDLITRQRESHDAADSVSAVAALPRTAIDTQPAIAPAVRDELSRGTRAVILLSDQPVDINDSRFGQLSPEGTVRNVGFRAMAARESPSPQVMVAVRNDSASPTAAELRVASGERQVTRTINLPPAGAEARYFIDVPGLRDAVQATLTVNDGCDADNVAWLVRAGPARIEVEGAVSDAVRRVVDVYNRARPGEAKAAAIPIVSRRSDLVAGDAGVIVEPPGAAAVSGDLRVASHPVTAVVDWGGAVKDALAAAAAPPTDEWTPLVTVGGGTLVAWRAAPARQLWVGFDAPQWPRSADFVVFWTNALDWVRGGDRAAEFTSAPVRLLPQAKRAGDPPPPNVDPHAWPGVYEVPGGQRIAMNALGVRFGNGTAPHPAIAPLLASATAGETRLAPWLLLAAIGCALIAATLWRERVRARAPRRSWPQALLDAQEGQL